jgi:hypothetical protein
VCASLCTVSGRDGPAPLAAPAPAPSTTFIRVRVRVGLGNWAPEVDEILCEPARVRQSVCGQLLTGGGVGGRRSAEVAAKPRWKAVVGATLEQFAKEDVGFEFTQQAVRHSALRRAARRPA